MTLDSSGGSRTDVKAGVGSMAAADLLLGIVGAVAGGVVGHYVFRWIAGQGLYAIALPGALTGLGCGALSGRRSVTGREGGGWPRQRGEQQRGRQGAVTASTESRQRQY